MVIMMAIGVGGVKAITRSEYNALLQWADDGGAVVDIEFYEILDDDPLQTSRSRESDESRNNLARNDSI